MTAIWIKTFKIFARAKNLDNKVARMIYLSCAIFTDTQYYYYHSIRG
jgi:hypothetical protein